MSGQAAGVDIAAPAYAPGSTLADKYLIVSVVGQGGMCVVYKAKNLADDCVVALKMPLPDLMSSDEFAERFRREGRAAGSLDHPNVVAVHDLGTTPDGTPFMVMDYLPGQTLEERIDASGRLAVARFFSIFDQVCAALQAAHQANIVHRDVKPSNIMLVDCQPELDLVK